MTAAIVLMALSGRVNRWRSGALLLVATKAANPVGRVGGGGITRPRLAAHGYRVPGRIRARLRAGGTVAGFRY